MLITKNIIKKSVLKRVTLLSFISIITFHTDTLAVSKKQLYNKYREQGISEQQKGNLNEALTHFSKAVSLGSDDPALYNDMGVIYEQMGLLGTAEKYYGMALRKDRSYLPAYSNMAMMYLNNGYPDKAFPFFKKRYELSQPGDAWGQKAKEEMLKIKPEYKAWFIGVEADKLNQQIIEKNHKDFVDRVTKANEHYSKGVKHADKQELEQAIAEFDLALQLTPDNPKIISARKEAIEVKSKKKIREQMDWATKQFDAGDSIAARRELQKILATFPDESQINSK